MPLLTLRYQLDPMACPRPRTTKQGHVYNPPEYRSYLNTLALETKISVGEISGISCDLVLYEFGVSVLSTDADNLEKALTDGLVQSGLLFNDRGQDLPIVTRLVFPISKGKEFIQATIVFQGTPEEEERYFRYRDRREKLSLDLIRKHRLTTRL